MSTARHPNLEEAFAPSGRGAGLEGLLQPRRSTQTTPTAPEPVDATGEPAAAAASPERPKRTRRTAGTTTQASSGQALNVAAYLPPATLAAAQREKQATGEQYADLLARAVDHVDQNSLRTAFTPHPAPSTEGGMPRRAVRARGAAGIQRQFRLSAEQRDWLDEQVRTYDAPSRSAFIATVLGLHFGTLAQQP